MIVAGALVGLAKGAIDAYSYAQEWDAKKKELETAQKNLQENYDLSVKQATEEAAEAETVLRANVADTKLAQGVGIRNAAHNAALQDQIAQQQMAELQISAREQQGAAVQNAAVSGVRQFGNAQAYRAGRAADRAMASAERQRELSRFQTLESARANYYNADRQIASYNRQIDYNSNELQRTLDRYETAYNQQYSANQKELDYMNSDEATFLGSMHMFFGVASSMLGGMTWGMGFGGTSGSSGSSGSSVSTGGSGASGSPRTSRSGVASANYVRG